MEASWTNHKPEYEKRRSAINKIWYNGEYITDKAHKYDAMNEYFWEVGNKLQEKMPDWGGEFLNYLPAQITATFFSVSSGQRGIDKWN